MGVFKLRKMTFGSLFKKPETVLYPIEKKPQPLGLKGHIVVNADDCILCGMCEKGCPTDCITVDKAQRTWGIMPFQCIQCGYCTRVCPKGCLIMDPNYWTAATSKQMNTTSIPEKDKPAAKASQAEVAQKPAKVENIEVTQPLQVKEEETAASAVDAELEAKLAIMDADKAERVRKALMSR